MFHNNFHEICITENVQQNDYIAYSKVKFYEWLLVL